MELRRGEEIINEIHRHFFPYHIIIYKVFFIGLPFYMVLFLLYSVASLKIFILASILVSLCVFTIGAYMSFVYWLDKLVITNQRVIFVEWKGFFSRVEESAELLDIQDIQTQENGVISVFKMFDFGHIEIRTASAKIVITFDRAPDPEGIKKFIEDLKNEYETEYNLRRVHGKIHEVQENINQAINVEKISKLTLGS